MSIDLSRIQVAAEKLRKKRSNTATASFCALYPDDKVEYLESGPCHYRLSSFKEGSECVVSFLQDSKLRELLSREEQELWLEYLFLHSPYSPWFITKDAEEALEQEWVAISSDAPSNLLASALVSTRHLWEKDGCIQIYSSLVRSDPSLNKSLAFLMAVGNRYLPTEQDCLVTHNPKEEGHMPFLPKIFSLGDVKNFLSHKLSRPNPPYKVNVHYNGLDILFVEEGSSADFYEYIGQYYTYGEPPSEDDRLNVFKSVTAKVHKSGGYQYDTLTNFTNNITPVLKRLEQFLEEDNV